MIGYAERRSGNSAGLGYSYGSGQVKKYLKVRLRNSMDSGDGVHTYLIHACTYYSSIQPMRSGSWGYMLSLGVGFWPTRHW